MYVKSHVILEENKLNFTTKDPIPLTYYELCLLVILAENIKKKKTDTVAGRRTSAMVGIVFVAGAQ